MIGDAYSIEKMAHENIKSDETQEKNVDYRYKVKGARTPILSDIFNSLPHALPTVILLCVRVLLLVGKES